MIEETWKPVVFKGISYIGFYEASNLGNIRSVERYITQKNGIRRKCKSIRLQPNDNNYGYLKVTLCDDNGRKDAYVHQIVAETFKPNPNNLPCINHKNGVKTDNREVNLEWCTYSENNNHANLTGLTLVGKDKPNARSVVNCRGQVFNTTTEAARTFGLFRDGNVSSVCKGKRKSAGKYPDTGEPIKWKYYEG